jgi:hypothetical protein
MGVLLPVHTVSTFFPILAVCIYLSNEMSCVLVNPFSRSHGAPTDEDRHVGDLGNFQTDSMGDSTGSFEDRLVKLVGPESVIGVSSLAHTDEVI